MASNFQFAFLGCQNNYFASVTKVVGAERPMKPSAAIIATYGLPDHFERKYKRDGATKYLLNIRGHDFLSHVGQWRNYDDGHGHVPASTQSCAEIEELQEWANINQARVKKNQVADMNVTFGPKAGSFFADVCEVQEYHKANLPVSLRQRIDSLPQEQHFWEGKFYGTIHDVAINANDSWVLVLKKGKQYEWSLDLPADLKTGLELGRNRGAIISRIFLNHQNEHEYVLLFSDGLAYAALHSDFREELDKLLKSWAKNRRKKLQLSYSSTDSCPQDVQRTLNATYYNQRGLFQLSRGSSRLALEYLEEAHKQNPTNIEIVTSLGMALVAVRRFERDEVLERYLSTSKEIRHRSSAMRQGPLGNFRMSYADMEASRWDMADMERRLAVFMSEHRRERHESWAYGMGTVEAPVSDGGPLEVQGSLTQSQQGDNVMYSQEDRSLAYAQVRSLPYVREDGRAELA